jgi:hypothetical protein
VLSAPTLDPRSRSHRCAVPSAPGLDKYRGGGRAPTRPLARLPAGGHSDTPRLALHVLPHRHRLPPLDDADEAVRRCCVDAMGVWRPVWSLDQMARTSSVNAAGSRCCGSISTLSSKWPRRRFGTNARPALITRAERSCLRPPDQDRSPHQPQGGRPTQSRRSHHQPKNWLGTVTPSTEDDQSVTHHLEPGRVRLRLMGNTPASNDW